MEEKNQSENPQEQELLTKSQKTKKIILLLAGLIGFNLFVFGTLYVSLEQNKNSNQEKKLTPTPSGPPALNGQRPFPFAEITIPYLRSRNYESSLGERSQVSPNSNYTSYLTSYNSEGFKVNGLLTIPKGEKPQEGFPAIVFVHGYIPPKNYQTLVNYSSYVDYLAKNGFVVFKIDLRGHGNSEGEPGGSYYSSDYIIDVLNARTALQRLGGSVKGKEGENLTLNGLPFPLVDPGKIGLWGHSMAGNVVSRALAAKPDIPAVVIFAGAVYTYEDFSEFSIQDNSYQPPPSDSPSRQKRNEMLELYGQFDPNSDFWKQVPMTNYLADIKGAISLNHAKDDNVVDIAYSRNLNSILNKTSIPHELNEYDSGGHNLTGAAFNQAMENAVDFFNKYLK